MDTFKRLRDQISALADGELPDSDRELALAALASDDGRAAWRAYHAIGDSLRAGADGVLSDDFATRLAQRLAAEAPLGGAPAAPSAPGPAAPGTDGELPTVIASAS